MHHAFNGTVTALQVFAKGFKKPFLNIRLAQMRSGTFFPVVLVVAAPDHFSSSGVMVTIPAAIFPLVTFICHKLLSAKAASYCNEILSSFSPVLVPPPGFADGGTKDVRTFSWSVFNQSSTLLTRSHARGHGVPADVGTNGAENRLCITDLLSSSQIVELSL